MLNTLIHLLQEVSERACGTALPPEICLAILVQWAGMRSPCASVIRSANKDFDCIGSRWEYLIAVETWPWRRDNIVGDRVGLSQIQLRVATDLERWVPKWAQEELSAARRGGRWPYRTFQDQLDGIMRGDRPKFGNPPRMFTEGSYYHDCKYGVVAEEWIGPCIRCAARTRMTSISPSGQRPYVHAVAFECCNGHRSAYDFSDCEDPWLARHYTGLALGIETEEEMYERLMV